MDDRLIGPVSPVDARIEAEKAWATPGTLRGNEIIADSVRQDWGSNVVTGLQDTAAAAGVRLARDEGTRFAQDMGSSPDNPAWENNALLIAGTAKALFGERYGEPDYDKSTEYARLTDGIPVYLHDEIMNADNLAAAERARSRVLTDMRRGSIIASQRGASSTFALLAGSVADVDVPLTLMTGGGFKAAVVAGKTLQLAQRAGVGSRWATRAASAGVGASAGLQAGLAVGIAEASWSETRDWTTVAEVALQSMLMGTVLNGVVNGDRQLAVRAAQQELHSRIARADPELNATLDVDAMPVAPVIRDEPFMLDSEGNFIPVPEVSSDTLDRSARREDMSVGAAATGTAQRFQQPPIVDPAGSVSMHTQTIIRNAATWRNDSGWMDRKQLVEDEWWTKVALHPMANLFTGNYRALYTSDAATLNWLAGNVFESANGLGRGRATAAGLEASYQRKIFGHISREVEPALNDWAKRHDATMGNTGFGVSQKGLAAFNREVMLELNDRAMGVSSSGRDAAVVRAADGYEKAGREALAIGKGKQGQIAVDGFDQIKNRNGYTPYIWNGGKLLQLIRDNVVNRQDVIDTMAQAYHTASGIQHKDAQKIADAVVQRAIARDVDVDMSVASMFTGDGREFLRESLQRANVAPREIDAIMRRMTGDAAERGKESFAKRRNEIDLNETITTRDGSRLQIVDLLDNDMHGTWQRYNRRLSGAAGLARVGLNNKAKIEDFITAARQEQRSLGEEPMDAELLRAMFSHFKGGPIHGYSRGVRNEGVGAEITLVKRMTNLSLLGKLGLAQIAETGATIAQTGLEAWWRRGLGSSFDQQLKDANSTLLKDMAYITGDLGQDHRFLAPHLDLDDMSRADRADWIKGMQRLTGQAQWLQAYTSLFNAARSHQQRIASMGMVDKVFRTVKAGMSSPTGADAATLRRFQDDLGLMPEDIQHMESLISSGTIEFTTHNGIEFVNRINIDKWADQDFADVFGVAINRNMNQVVQRSMAGEQDAWMHTSWGSVLTHLKTFPMLALQKQFIRNMRHMDQQTLNTLMYGMATAMVATTVRDAIDGKERTMQERARIAFNYSNITGWLPMAVDPVLAAAGLEDYRINPFGPTADYTPPTMTWINRAASLPGALKDTARGEADWYDVQSLRALPFANTLGFARILDAV